MIDLYQAIRKTIEFKRLLTGLLAGLLLFVTLIFAASYKLKRENEISRWVLHSQEEIYQIEKTISLVKDYETGSRGFILTNQDSYEKPLTEASKNLDSVLVHLEELIAGDAVQKQHLDSLSIYLHKKIDFSTTAIKVRREQGLEQALSLFKTNNGKEYMDRTRHIADAMHLHAQQVLAQRKNESAEAAQTANQILFASIVFFILLLLYVLWKSWQQEQEKRIAGEKLKQKEEYYRALIEHNSDAILLQDKEGLILEVNQSFCDIFGVTREEAMKRPTTSFLPPDIVPACKRYFQESLLGSTTRYDIGMISANGELRTYDVVKFPVNVNGGVAYIKIILKDITETVRAYRKIQEQADKLNTIFESITDGFITMDREWRLTYINSEAERLVHFDRQKHIGISLWEVFPEQLGGEFHSQYTEAFDTGKAVRFTSYLKESSMWLQVKAFPSAEGLSVYFDVVTELVRSKQELEKLSLVASKIAHGVIITGPDGLTEWINNGFTNLTGYQPSEIIGKKPGALLQGAETDKEAVQYIRQMLKKAVPFSTKIINYKKCGEKLWFSMDITPILNEAGHVERFIAIQKDITDSRRASEQIRQSEVDLAEAQQIAKIGSWNLDMPTERLTCSNELYRIFGINKVTFRKTFSSFLDFVDEGDLEFAIQTTHKAYNTGEPFEVVYRITTGQGEKRILHVIGKSQANAEGKVVRLYGTAQDVTERKLAEMQLKESERNLKAILSSSQEAIYLLDLNCRLVLLNEHSRDILRRGYGVECKPGDDFPALFEPAFGSMLKSIYERVLAGEKYDTERLYPLEDGDAFYYSSYFPVKDNEGNIIGICCAAKNITHRKQIEEAIRTANAEKEEYQYRFKAILDYSPQAILIKDMDGKYIFSNKAFLDLLKFDKHNEVDLQLKAVFDDEEIRAEFLTSCMEGNTCETKSKEWEQQVLLPNGQIVVLEITKFPLYDRQKQLFGVCTLCKDITEQMQHQQQLIVARENAEQAERLQEQFLANMSHELRTPMNGIIGMVNLLLTSSSLQPDQTGRLQVIRRSSDTLLCLINDILDLSKIKAGMLTIEKVNFEFNESIAGTAMLFKERARDKGVKLVVAADPFIPRLLCGDPHRLNQILNNLLSNAVKFTDKGFVRLEASLQSESEDQVVIEFVVSDSGIGIDAANLHYIFDNFAQASTDISSKYGGTGLGLAITKRLIEMQGGEITVESTKGVGSSFTFHLPYAITKDTNAVVNPYYHQAPSSVKKNYSGKRALIVEDNDINQAVLISSLKQHHIEHLIANNGQEAVDILESGEKFDIIFMDLRMPVMNGFQTTAYIRQKLQLQVPIVVLTASVLRNERDRCLEIGASDYMAKPFAMADLARALEQFLPASDQQITDGRAESPSETASKLAPESDFDISRLLELDAPEYIRHILTLFTGKMPAYLQELKTLLPTDNWMEFLEKTHKIKGSLSTIHIREMNELILAMEEKVHDERSVSGIEPLLEKCLALYDRVIPAIKEEVEKQLATLEPNY